MRPFRPPLRPSAPTAFLHRVSLCWNWRPGKTETGWLRYLLSPHLVCLALPVYGSLAPSMLSAPSPAAPHVTALAPPWGDRAVIDIRII